MPTFGKNAKLAPGCQIYQESNDKEFNNKGQEKEKY